MLKVLAKALTTTIIFFLIAELALRGVFAARNAMLQYVPLPYALDDDYGPIPPWLDSLLILQDDDALIWKSEPYARRTYVDIFSPVRREADRIALLHRFRPSLPREFQANPRWSIALNSHGDRAPEMSPSPAAGTIRVACIGDSWTFGMNVDQDRTYPARLAAWLQAGQPDARYEVLNFGVLGYSSFQGLQLLKHRVLDLKPDVLVIGFGMNDSGVVGYRDKDVVSNGPPKLSSRLKEAGKSSRAYQLIDYFARLVRFRPRPMSEYVREQQKNIQPGGAVDYNEMEPWTRVSPRDYELNVREMITLERQRGGAVVLLDNELWADSPYRPLLKKISSELHVPLVDSLALIDAAKRQTERDLETKLGLARASDGADDAKAGEANAAPTTAVFRVHRGRVDVPKALSIVGIDPQLGALLPNHVLMHDDGRDGDERAGDGVWSYAVKFAAGTRIAYAYTNSGATDQWEGLDVPRIRSVNIPPNSGGPAYLPVETFGEIYLQADNWHTNAAGYDLIGKAAADAIIQSHRH